MKHYLAAILSVLFVGLVSPSIIPTGVIEDAETDVLKSNSTKDTLIFAHVIFRHGDAIHTLPGMPLTNEGKRQLFKSFQFFRRRYMNLLGGKYSPNKVYVHSTDTDRSIMSAQANLAGFFPPKSEEEKWHDEIYWQPIPVHTMPDELDTLLHSGRPCPKYRVMYKYYMEESPEARETMAKYKDEISYWAKKSERDLETIEDVTNLYKRLMADDAKGEPLPKWAKKAIEPNGPMAKITRITYKLRGTPKLVRLRSGFLIKDILERSTKKIEGTLDPDRVIWMYSGHSTTLATMLNGLQIFELNIPPYGSSLHFELYKTPKNEHYLQFVYRRFDVENPKPSSIPGIGKQWTVEDFYSVHAELIPGDFESECKL